jgi:hypothetical protein
MAKDGNDLPKRENKEQRKQEQKRAAEIERESFSVPDRPGRPKGDYNYERD